MSGMVEAACPVGEVSDFLQRLTARGPAAARSHWASTCRSACPAPMPRNARRPTSSTSCAASPERPDFFRVCDTLADIRLDRPFYPQRGVRGMTRLSHAAALGLGDAAGLSRLCDRATPDRPAGAPVFWTLGANQSGKAAIAAWRDLLLPALRTMRRSGCGRSRVRSMTFSAPALLRSPRPIRPRRCAISTSACAAASAAQSDRAALAPALLAADGASIGGAPTRR